MWGRDWDLPTLIAHCADSEVLAVELCTTHAHGVEASLNEKQRLAVRNAFEESPVHCVGIGSSESFDAPDHMKLKQSVAAAQDFIRLSHDVGGSGVKVKSGNFHNGVTKEQTVEQVGKTLRDLAIYGDGFGQEIRLEVEGEMADFQSVKSIMDVADHPAARLCWNCNQQDLHGDGLVANFKVVNGYFGRTSYVREFDAGKYPHGKLLEQFVRMDYSGWLLLKGLTTPPNPVESLAEQRRLFFQLIAQGQGRI